MASKTILFLTLPTPMTFEMYEENVRHMLGMKKAYQDLWYYRSIGEAERHAVNGKEVCLPMATNVTVERYVKIFPDAAQHLPALAKLFQTDKVMQLMRRAGCAGRDPAWFSMHGCFAGHLHKLEVADMRKVKKHHLKKADRVHALGH